MPKPEEKPLLVDSGTKIVVKGFTFSGDISIISEKDLQPFLKLYIGKETGFAELQQLTQNISAFLQDKKGYLLARAYLPKQDVTAGIIEIAILAGRIEGAVQVNVQAPRRIRQGLLEKMLASEVPGGAPVLLNRLERSVLLMNDLPGITARASLERGSLPGTSQMVVDVKEGPLVTGTLAGDNYGNRYTGSARRLGQVAINDLFGVGDQISTTLVNADHMNEVRAGYKGLLGYGGTTWNVSYNQMKYDIAGKLVDLKAKGWTKTAGAGIDHPLVRTRDTSFWTGVGVERNLLQDKANELVTSERRVPVGDLHVNGSSFDHFGRGGITSVYAAFFQGSVAMKDESSDAAGARSAGRFSRFEYSLARLQGVSRSVSFFASARGQFADSNLDSSQKFILGGPTGVRAYPVGEGAGDAGHVLTFETRCDILGTPAWARTQLVGFVDTGYVRLHKDTWSGAVTNISGRDHYWISGAGPGITVGKSGVYSLQVSYAHKIGKNPGRNTDDMDSNNRNDNGRFWLQAVIWF